MRGATSAFWKVKAALAGLVMVASVGVDPSQATDMTAGSILEKMPAKERYAYISGIVEGLAYARFRKDTIAAGEKVETGMQCIYGWYFAGDGSTYDRIEAVFRKNATFTPSVLIAAMLKKECGE